MSKVIFKNLVDKEGNQLSIDVPEPNDNLKRLMELESIRERASASGKRLRDIVSKEKMIKVLNILDNVNDQLDELEIKHKRDQAIKDANLLIDRAEEILICWFSDKYEKSFKFNDSRKRIENEIKHRRDKINKDANEAEELLHKVLDNKGAV